MFAAHQRQFDLVLHILDVECTALAYSSGQRANDVSGEFFNGLVHPARSCRGVSLDRQKGLGHGHRNLAGIERRHRAVAPDHLQRRFSRCPRQRFRTQLNERRSFGGFAIERE
jgi:hypothetical protein